MTTTLKKALSIGLIITPFVLLAGFDQIFANTINQIMYLYCLGSLIGLAVFCFRK